MDSPFSDQHFSLHWITDWFLHVLHFWELLLFRLWLFWYCRICLASMESGFPSWWQSHWPFAWRFPSSCGNGMCIITHNSCLYVFWLKFYFINTEMQYLSPDTSHSLPSFCFGFIALALNSHKSWSFSTRAKLAKLSHSLNRLPRKDTAFPLFTLWTK